MDLVQLGQRAKAASRQLARATTEQKNTALTAIADALEACTEMILEANQVDLEAARAKGLPETLIRDRFDLANRMRGMIADVRKVVELPDPVGRVYDERTLPNGLRVSKRRTPIGVIGVIYEARPNVTVDVATLALKTSNTVILRGGSEVYHSNMALVRVIRDALAAANLMDVIPPDAILTIESTDRAYVEQLLKLHQYVDMIIPRGGNALHQFCRENSTIPVITGGIGICHLFVDETADLDAALPVIYNAKTQRPSVCNALDTLLVHEKIAASFLPRVVDRLADGGVVFKAEPRALAALGGHGGERVSPAGPEDFDIEWLGLTLGLKVVDSLDEAIEHIHQHSTQHSDGILTRSSEQIERFISEVDSSAVFVNASTRFNDGSALGLGAEVAISTQKLHARGPMALEELTTYKWIVIGENHVRP